MAKEPTKKKKSSSSKDSVRIFTTPTCPWCQKTKDFLKEINVSYKEINVADDEESRNEMFDKSGQMGVPVLDVKGTIIVGYDKKAIKKALEL